MRGGRSRQCTPAVDRRDAYVERYGFDNLLTSFTTAFSVTILDSWPGIANKLSAADSTTHLLALPLITLMVLCISLVIVNL